MREREFQSLLAKLHGLTARQRKAVEAALGVKSPMEEVAEVINGRLADHPECPRCESQHIQKWGVERGIQRFRCKDCGRHFNALTGTPLARLRHREAWGLQGEAVRDGLSVRKTAQKCGVARSTAFRWRHRWLTSPNEQKDTAFTGIVEADETYVLESFKGSKAWARTARGLPTVPPPGRPPRKRGGKAGKRGLSVEQIPVLVVRDRHGATTDAVLPAVNKAAIKDVLKPILNADTLLCTDGLRLYKLVAKEEGFAHQPLNLKAGTRVKERVFHIQHVNAYHERLKGWMMRFRGVATKNLPNYLGWRRLLEHNGDGLTQWGVLSAAIRP